MGNEQITVMVLIKASWTPNLTDDVAYPTIGEYAMAVRDAFDTDPLAALRKLPDPVVMYAAVETRP